MIISCDECSNLGRVVEGSSTRNREVLDDVEFVGEHGKINMSLVRIDGGIYVQTSDAVLPLGTSGTGLCIDDVRQMLGRFYTSRHETDPQYVRKRIERESESVRELYKGIRQAISEATR